MAEKQQVKRPESVPAIVGRGVIRGPMTRFPLMTLSSGTGPGQWNVKSDERSVGQAPASIYWATDPGGFGQVGCVYTAQGFEYNWAGVILGPDLVVRGGQVETVRDGNKDPAFKSRKTVSDAGIRSVDPARVYRVLLTRGLDGIVLHAVDPATQEFLEGLVRPTTQSTSAAS